MATPPTTHAVYRVTVESDITGDELAHLFKLESGCLDGDNPQYALFEYRSSSYGYLETIGPKADLELKEAVRTAEERLHDYAGLDGEVTNVDRILRD